MKWFLIIAFIFLSGNALAESHDELVHFAAHAGTSYAIAMVSDQFYNKFLGWSPGNSLLGGLTTALVAGSLYKIVETGKPSSIGDGIIYNGIGALGAIGTIFVFDLNIGD
jgi:hypothetical protein